MLFDLPHILFMVVSLIIMIASLILFHFYVKDENKKNLILKVFAVATVVIHFSSLWVDYFKTGSANVEGSMLLPIYPCNIAMWLLLIVSFMKNKQSKTFNILAEFTFYLGITGGIIGIAFNEIYSNNPNLADYGVLKGLLSHDTMLLGCIYLLSGGYIKIRVSNMISCAIGLIGMLIDGGIIIGLYKAANLTPPNCMYLLENPFPAAPWFSTWLIGLFALILLFLITMTYEFFALKSEDRWYNKLKQLKHRFKKKGE